MNLFNKLTKAIISAVQEGGNTESNVRLQLVIAQAKANNLPNDKIKSALDSLNKEKLEEAIYEVTAPGGVGLLVTILTDNKNRSIAQLRYTADKNQGKLGGGGTVLRNFKRQGSLTIKIENDNKEAILENCLVYDTEDIIDDDHSISLIFNSLQLMNEARNELTSKGFQILNMESGMVAANLVELEQEESDILSNLIEKITDLDDVQQVYHNAIMMEPLEKE